ncbi:hypothetical protein [Streptomyces iranensis]|uniref:Uncharacterized protein n=1 Tax=Streptomyces iranensis TaxID=576784 RepID=A0A061AAC3_9ACTN|nr:hypothetical protein [Streptomyces iranensis]MBP2060278.1 hypothetical protein [Streptomyces iranensis]CDR15884.1 predicted protein [Streptomyces iranensis]
MTGFSRATGLPTWHDHVLVNDRGQVRIGATRMCVWRWSTWVAPGFRAG